MVPSGVVTLLFTDIEGSTRAWEAHPNEMRVALARHDDLVRAAIEDSGGYVFKTVGDAYCAAFSDAAEGVAAAVAAQRAIANEPWPEVTPIRVRMGLHSGACEERSGDYFGPSVNRVARLEAIAHGGQIVLSRITADLVGDRLGDSVTLRDLGEHRLKDLSSPEHVLQVCGSGLVHEFPPLQSLDNPRLRHNLPVQLSSFVGRDQEIAEIRELLDRSRLVTLAGPGGAGKTRLALQAAAELLDGSGDGVWFVELASLSDPDLVASTVANVLGVREDPGRSILDTLVDALGDRDLLVLLDNCEHVVDAAAKLADVVLRSCPNVELLATSREPLAITGECVYRVSSLGLPSAEETDAATLAASESVQLFVARAAQRDPTFSFDSGTACDIARICRRLDGIPLAIELAVARLRTLSPEELNARLDQRFRMLTGGSRSALPRQQTLQALIDWSYDLLTEPEQTLLGCLSVFVGGWDLDAVEAIAADVISQSWELLDHLSALADKSLVQVERIAGTTRYRLLETVREYAATKTEERRGNRAADVRRAHRDYYLALAETAAPRLIRDDQLDWLNRLEREHDNLRAALAACVQDAEPELGLRLAIALRWFWDIRGYVTEGAATLQTILGSTDTGLAPALYGRALSQAGDLVAYLGDSDGATYYERAKTLAHQHNDDLGAAEAMRGLAWISLSQGEPALALQRNEEGLRYARVNDDDHLVGRLLGQRAVVLQQFNDQQTALVQFAEAVALLRDFGDRSATATTLGNCAIAELDLGIFESAREHLTESIALAQAVQDPRLVMYLSVSLGLMELIEGDREVSRRLIAEALPVARRAADLRVISEAHLGLALVSTRDSDYLRAAKLHGASDTARELTREILDPWESRLRDADLVQLRDALGDDEFDAAYRSGQILSMDDAIALALSGGDD